VLVAAFLSAGAVRAANFQTNGTVVFSARSGRVFSARSGRDSIGRLRPLLLEATGYSDTIVVRPAAWVAEVGRRLDSTLPGGEVALFDAPGVPELGLPWVDPDGDVTVLELDELHAVTAWAATGPARGSNLTLARMLGVPVTCRGIPTMIRLTARLRSE